MAGEGQVIACHTVESWKEQLEQGKAANKLIVVDFMATWCGPCRMIAPILTELAKNMTNVLFLKVDVDELRTVAEEWKVEAMPTIIFLKDGNVVEKIVGVRSDLASVVEKHATASV